MPQRLSDVPLAQLIRETQEWNNGHGIQLLAWIGCVGSVDHAIAYGELFWPEFVEFEGCIFFAGFSEESYRSCLAQAGSNRRSVEALLNHRHLLDLFSGSATEPTRPQLVYLGRLLRELWAAKLRQDFPDKHFTVSFPEVELDCLTDYQITLYQSLLCD